MDTGAIAALRDQIHGPLVQPGDPSYDDLRGVWNAMVDRRPRLIARCLDVGDVVAAVRAARESGLEIGVRCGGHSVTGLAVPEDGLMIDLTAMGAAQVDAPGRRARVQGGALLGALDQAAQQHGLATTAGNVSHTGVGGLTLGGGMGWLARQHGLTCDNLASCEVVTADGEVVRASPDENLELFWGLRGGGGNFGIVTEFEFRLHPVGTRALLVELAYPLDEAATVLKGWRELAVAAPRPATFTMAVAADDVASVGYVWVGDPDEGWALLPTLRDLGRPVQERAVELSYLDLQRIEDTPEGYAYRRYWKGHYLPALPDAVIEPLLGRGDVDGPADLLLNVGLQTYRGAIADVADDDTAFSHRDTMFEYVAAARWTDPADDTDCLAAARRCAGAIDPFARGAYVNALSDEGDAGVQRAYTPHKLARLTALKRTYDPDNVFRLNHNIPPA